MVKRVIKVCNSKNNSYLCQIIRICLDFISSLVESFFEEKR